MAATVRPAGSIHFRLNRKVLFIHPDRMLLLREHLQTALASAIQMPTEGIYVIESEFAPMEQRVNGETIHVLGLLIDADMLAFQGLRSASTVELTGDCEYDVQDRQVEAKYHGTAGAGTPRQTHKGH